MIKDKNQKEMLYNHFRAQGWLAQIEVPVTPSVGVSQKLSSITDIDVLGIRQFDLKWHYVIGDCKTKKNESPINRVLWVRGLIDLVGASSAVVLLQKQPGAYIDRDHKLVADEQRVLLIQESEFRAYDKAIVYPYGSAGYSDELVFLEILRQDLPKNFPALATLTRWIMSDAWAISEHSTLLRLCLHHLNNNRGELDPRRADHFALILEGCVIFSIAFATIVGKVFRRHIQPDERTGLEEALRVIIWGGRQQYDFYADVQAKIGNASSRGKDPLALPEWGRFLELTRSLLEAPRYAFRVPQLLRQLSTSVISSGLEEVNINVRDNALVQFTLKLAEYVCRASGMPQDASSRFRQLLIPRMTQLATNSTRGIEPDTKEQSKLFSDEVAASVGSVTSGQSHSSAVDIDPFSDLDDNWNGTANELNNESEEPLKNTDSKL